MNITNKILDYLDEQFYLFNIINNVKNHSLILKKKIIIAFAGIPGCGKSTIAKLLEQELKYFRIESDAIREFFRINFNYSLNSEEILIGVAGFLSKNLESNFILDSSVDRKFRYFKEFTDKTDFKIIVISIEIPVKDALQRIHSRKNGFVTDQNKIKIFFDQHNLFLESYSPDISVGYTDNLDSTMTKILKKIQIL